MRDTGPQTTQKKTITKTETGWKSAYGALPIRCDGHHVGVHQYEFLVVKQTRDIAVGIDEGRTHADTSFHGQSNNGYAMFQHRLFYTKGTLMVLSICSVS